ncbi:MAG: 4Fe-4S dicluster domain-containing protein, partial [Bdellovibrionota bacterium]
WPSAGVRALSLLCAEMGLSVGLFGGELLQVRGVIPLPVTGGLVLIEDIQRRLHRIEARAVVKVSVPPVLPDPFPGWRSQGLIPLPTAIRLRSGGRMRWDPSAVILGTGNKALRFGSELLESGAAEVYCVETHAQWGAKRFAGWEVEKRRFEMGGGKILEAKPVSLTAKGPLLWELRLQDTHGVRVIETARVISAGPFQDLPGVREYPSGSYLFELEQTAAFTKPDDVEGWVTEEERGKWLASKIVRALMSELGHREDLDQVYRRARSRLRRFGKHREEPFTPAYQGKWIATADSRAMRGFSGVPKTEQKRRPIASVECFEEISCNICQTVCPTQAILTGKIPRSQETPVLTESKCTGCGLCLTACPSSAIVLVEEREDRSFSQLTLPWRGEKPWKAGETATLLNRRGESLGSARVVALMDTREDPQPDVQLVQLEVPTHLLWDARALRRPRAASATDPRYLESISRAADEEPKVEVSFNGEKRLVRDKIPVSLALFEIGRGRPEDVLLCTDGTCGLCQVQIDGVKKLGCQTTIHRGMAIKLEDENPGADV